MSRISSGFFTRKDDQKVFTGIFGPVPALIYWSAFSIVWSSVVGISGNPRIPSHQAPNHQDNGKKQPSWRCIPGVNLGIFHCHVSYLGGTISWICHLWTDRTPPRPEAELSEGRRSREPLELFLEDLVWGAQGRWGFHTFWWMVNAWCIEYREQIAATVCTHNILFIIIHTFLLSIQLTSWNQTSLYRSPWYWCAWF